MSRERLISYAGPAAMLGGALYLMTFAMAYLIYGVFEQQAKGTFVAAHAFIHSFDTPMFALLALGAIGVYLREAGRLGKVGKAGFYVTLAGFGISVVGGLVIIVVGLAVSDKATLGLLDINTHPLAHVLYAVGSLIFGIATFRANVLPRGAALLAAVGPIWLFAMFMTGFGGGEAVVPLVPPVFATTLGWMWLGYALRSKEFAPELAEPAAENGSQRGRGPFRPGPEQERGEVS